MWAHKKPEIKVTDPGILSYHAALATVDGFSEEKIVPLTHQLIGDTMITVYGDHKLLEISNEQD